MHILFANIHALPEPREEYLQALLTHAENTRAEPGCVRFDVLQDNDDPNCFRRYEVYQDEAAYNAHGKNPSIAVTLEKVAPWKEKPTVQHACTNVSPIDSACG